MKTYLDCIPCMMEQALQTGRIATSDESKIKALLDVVGDRVKDIPLENTPPETATFIYQKIKEITGDNDPYKKIKDQNIKQVIKLYPYLKDLVNESDDPLLMAIRLAIAGNVIDYGANRHFHIEDEIEKAIDQDFAVLDYDKFKNDLKKARSILYLGDNAGESVFDKLLIATMGKPVTYVVREEPIINDVTMEDAVKSGIGEVAEIISSGAHTPAIILKLCNKDFIKKFNEADLVISKGQGNYEGLSEIDRSIFFLLKAKCELIARELDVDMGSIVMKVINL
ncbi:MAG: ARMT1-like domain-containing protein [Calditrichaceae bacterium]